MARIWIEKLEEVMRERGLRPKPLALAAGLNENYIRDLMQKGVDPTISKFSAVADVLGLPLSYFFSEKEFLTPQIPVVGYAAGGDKWTAVSPSDESVQLDHISMDANGIDPIAIRVRGHSMFPVYRDGDNLICSRQRGADISRAVGHDCVVLTTSHECYVKMVLKGASRNTYRLRSYNSVFPDIEDVALEWAAPVVWIKRA